MEYLIILAKVETTGTRATGKIVERDMNLFPEIETVPQAKALVYSSHINDIEKAKAFAVSGGWECWIMEDDSNVLQKAKDRAMSNADISHRST